MDHARVVSEPGPAIFRRLWGTGLLDAGDMHALAHLGWERREVKARNPFDPGENLCILSSGFGFRQRNTAGGVHSFVSLIVPGDICSYVFVTGNASQPVFSAATPCMLMQAPLQTVSLLCEKHPNILAAILSNLAVDKSTTEELVTSLGCRTALERVAHFLCEVEFRLRRMGLVDNMQFQFQLTQAEIGEYLALSAVHVNRTLQELRRRELIRTQGARISLLDRDELQKLAGFSLDYLQDRVQHRAAARFDA